MLKQLSIWLPNKPGTLNKFMEKLIKNSIEIRAITVAENEEYGLILLLVNKPTKLYTLLQEAEFPVSLTEVLAIKLNSKNNTANLKEISKILGQNDVNIEYLYSTLVEDESFVILKVDDNEKAKEVLKEDGFLLEEREAI